MLTCYVLLAVVAAAQGRAVNISNTWVLPEEGFPVFYRYFRDRISWYEADAVCQFHHANLVTVDTTAQYDAVRAYLKELDISSAVWVGLIRSNPEGQFTWTDYNALTGDGYWSSAPDARAAPLCAAADPAADYRWEARACGGPTVASFICELPVPQWAVGNQGCMVRALPALTVLYLPESAAVQLTADCGLAGTKRVQCTGNVKREDLLKNLSCVEEVDATSIQPSAGTAESVTTDTTYTDQDTTNEVTTEQNTSPEHITDTPTPTLELKSTLTPILPSDLQNKRKVLNKLNIIHTNENLNLDLIHNNNLQSNDIPKLGYNDNFLTVEQTEKIEDEKHFSHKMMHEELARHGNFENIFTQPTDHFIPPLVMAKAKISDDMTVLSLAEKHAQQLAEQRHTKQNMQSQYKPHIGNTNPNKVTTEEPNKVEILDKPLVLATQSKVQDTERKDKVKPGLPKKYKDKYDDPKSRTFRTIDNKLGKLEKSTQSYSTQSEITTRPIQTDTTPINNIKPEEDASIDLTVMLKELGVEDRVSRYSNYSTKIHKVDQEPKTTTAVSTPESTTIEYITTTPRTAEIQTKPPQNIPIIHEVIQITMVNDNAHSSNPTTTVFEITTRMPEFKDNENNYFSSHPTNTVSEQITPATTLEEITPVNPIATERSEKYTTSPTNVDITSSIISTHNPLEPQKVVTPTEINTSTKSNEEQVIIKSTTESIAINKTKDIDVTAQPVISTTPTASTTTTPTTLKHIDVVENYTESISKNIKNITDTSDLSKITKDESTTSDIDHTNTGKKEVLNYTMSLEDDYAKNWTDSLEAIDDFQSPLLSGANEPAHRPNRSRRPQPARLNKFNPFRILG